MQGLTGQVSPGRRVEVASLDLGWRGCCRDAAGAAGGPHPTTRLPVGSLTLIAKENRITLALANPQISKLDEIK